MPTAAPHACGRAGCSEVVPRRVRYCDKHRRESHRAIDAQRGNSYDRGYDRTWQRLRRLHLAQHPLCVMCQEQGRLKAATVVDHIKSVEERPDLRLDPSNLRSLCAMHHNQRTARDQGFAQRGRVGAGRS